MVCTLVSTEKCLWDHSPNILGGPAGHQLYIVSAPTRVVEIRQSIQHVHERHKSYTGIGSQQQSSCAGLCWPTLTGTSRELGRWGVVGVGPGVCSGHSSQ